jgi:DNA polymerase-3 subunit delta'
MIFSWQQEVWRKLQQSRMRLPHALLLHGMFGIGKRDFAICLAQSLLCERPLDDGLPCASCASCSWYTQYSHPDFRRIRPDSLEESVNDDDSVESEAKKSDKTVKTPSKEVRIEQVRAIAGFMNLSTHRRGLRVVLLYPAENLNTASANALLKTLEEPPANTVLILVCNRIDRLLPTILSRCHKLAMPQPSRQESLAWLKQHQISDADYFLDEQGGSPLAALTRAKEDNRLELEYLIGHFVNPSSESTLTIAEKLQKTSILEFVVCLQRWLYDVFSCKFSGTIRYYPRYREQLLSISEKVDVGRLNSAIQAFAQRRAIADHPLAPKLFIEDMLLDYARIFS